MPTLGSFSPPLPKGHMALAVCILILTAGAWGGLSFLDGASPEFSHHHHHLPGAHAGITGLSGLLFTAGWALMTVAMMLPTSLPVLTVFSTIAGERSNRTLLISLVVVGYLLVWTLFGGVVFLGTRLWQWFASATSWPAQYSWAHAPSLLLLAGIFQFTPLKYRCLDKCRSPFSFVMGHWQGRHEQRQAFRLGVDHGLFCVGCCWALMLLMFIVSTGSLLWMLVLAVVMGLEKNAPWGRRLSTPLGAVLLLSAGVLAWQAYSSI
jgi:predicted metal-binding membrane protein